MIHYRSNVAALILNANEELLICERANVPGSWQFPQGGVDPGESLKEALFREVNEEVGLKSKHYDVVEQRGGYRYLYPPEIQQKKIRKNGYHGQEQSYFLCKLKPLAPAVDIDQKPREFRDFRWIQPQEFKIEWLPEFKKEVYRAVMNDFFQIKL